MLKFVTTILALLFIAIMAGCGSGGSGTSTATFPAKVSLKDSDVSGKTFYSASGNVFVTYQFNANGTVGATTDKWQIVPIEGTINWTDANGNIVHKFTCIQKEPTDSPTYWLIYDKNNQISRFYFDTTSVQNYLDSIAAKNVTPNGVKLGGSVQLTSLPVFSNVSTAAGSTTGKAGRDENVEVVGTNAHFYHPLGVTTDGEYLYVADSYNNMIRKITIGSWAVTRLAGSADGLAGNKDATGDAATFNHPAGITTDGTNLYVADSGNNTIRMVDKDGKVTLFAGSTDGAAGAVDSTTGTDARFNQPFGITTDGTNLYVSDYGNHTIRKIVISSKAVVTLAGSAGTAGSADDTKDSARFNLPAHITTDGSNLYVADFRNRTIRKIVIATGTVTTLAGSAGIPGTTDGAGADARFYQPNGITTDGVNLYVTDSSVYANNIRKVVISSGEVTTLAGVAGYGNSGYVNSAADTSKFDGPAGITTDGIRLFVADSLNNSIRMIQE